MYDIIAFLVGAIIVVAIIVGGIYLARMLKNKSGTSGANYDAADYIAELVRIKRQRNGTSGARYDATDYEDKEK